MFKLPSYRSETVRLCELCGGTTLHFIALSYKDRAVISWTPSSYLTQFHRCDIKVAYYICYLNSTRRVSHLYYRSGIPHWCGGGRGLANVYLSIYLCIYLSICFTTLPVLCKPHYKTVQNKTGNVGTKNASVAISIFVSGVALLLPVISNL